MAARRFEFEEGTSSKFWAVERDGRSVTVTFGRIGTTGQEKTKSFPDEGKASHEEEKLIAEKLGKGYLEVTGGAKAKPKSKAAQEDHDEDEGDGDEGDDQEKEEEEEDEEDDGEPKPPPKGFSKPTTWAAIAEAWSGALKTGKENPVGDTKAVAEALGIKRLPPSYLEYLERFKALGELELRYEREDFPNYLNIFDPDDLIKQREAHGEALDVFGKDVEATWEPIFKAARTLLPFGYDTSRTVICWDPALATPDGELAISFFNYEFGRHMKLGDLKDVLKYYRPGSMNQ